MPCLWDLLTQGCTGTRGKQGNKLEQDEHPEHQQKPSPRKVRFKSVTAQFFYFLTALMALSFKSHSHRGEC